MSTDMAVGRATTSTVVVYPDIQELLGHIEPPKKMKVAIGCPLCDKIWSSKEEYEYIMDWPDKIAIVMEGGEPWLYVPCEDSYYSDTKIQTNYCPFCGRKLVAE